MKISKLTVPVLAALAGLTPFAAVAQMNASSEVDTSLLPPNAVPGECYARVFVPPSYRTDTESVLRKEAGERIELLPAQYTTATQQVLVREESERLEVVPATYKWMEETVMVKPETKRLVEVPEVWETVTEQVLDKPAHQVWKKGRGPIEKVDNGTGEIMCLIEVPATYKTVSKRVLTSAATVKEVIVPAEYKTVRRKVVDQPATTRTVTIPAEYDTVTVTKLVSEPSVQRTEIPAEYQTVSRQVLVRDGYLEWQQVLCETNMTVTRVKSIQRALQTAGYDPGKIDGIIGSDTRAAVRAFQQKMGLATGGITSETLKKLGV